MVIWLIHAWEHRHDLAADKVRQWLVPLAAFGPTLLLGGTISEYVLAGKASHLVVYIPGSTTEMVMVGISGLAAAATILSPLWLAPESLRKISVYFRLMSSVAILIWLRIMYGGFCYDQTRPESERWPASEVLGK